MTDDELRDLIKRRKAAGLRYVVLSAPRPRDPGPRRVRILPGVTGDSVGWNDGRVLVDVAVADLERYLERR